MSTQCLAKMFSTDIGIDLGTANCLVYVRDMGIVLAEPSVVAIKESTRQVLNVGSEAKSMLGKCPCNIRAIRPMKDGVIADFEITEEMLRYFIQKAIRTVPWRKRLLHPRVLVAVPSGITEVENRAVKASAKRAGAGEVVLVEEPMAAAVGVGLPVAEPAGSMIVDIGGGTTEVAVISLSGIVGSKSVRVGGDELDGAIIQHLKRVYNLMIGELTAEQIKIRIGSAYPVKDDESLEVKGLDLVSRVPKTVRVSAAEIRMALQEPITTIIEAVRATLERCPPDLAADLIDRGIMLAGGGDSGVRLFAGFSSDFDSILNGTGILAGSVRALNGNIGGVQPQLANIGFGGIGFIVAIFLNLYTDFACDDFIAVSLFFIQMSLASLGDSNCAILRNVNCNDRLITRNTGSSKRGNLQETDTHGQDQDQRLQTFGRVLHDTFSSLFLKFSQ